MSVFLSSFCPALLFPVFTLVAPSIKVTRCLAGVYLVSYYVMILNNKCYKIPLRLFCTVWKITEEDAIPAEKEAILRQFSEKYSKHTKLHENYEKLK